MLELRVLLLISALASLLSPGGGFPSAGTGSTSPERLPGIAVYYAPSWDWSRIAEIQGVMLPEGRTPIATAGRPGTPACQMLGRTGWLALGSSMPFPIVVADCTAPRDLQSVWSRRIVAEVPYPVAQQVPGMLSRGSAPAVLWLDPPKVPAPVPSPVRLAPRMGPWPWPRPL